MRLLCQALAFLFAFLVLAHGPVYNVQPGPASHPMTPPHPANPMKQRGWTA